MIWHVVQTLIETVPVDYLMRSSTLEIVADKVNEKLSGSDVNKGKVVEMVERTDSVYKTEVMEIVNVIVERAMNRDSGSSN